MAAHETIFSMDTSSIKFGPGSTSEVGYEMRRLGARRVLVVTDPSLADSQAVATTVKAIRSEGIDVVIFDNARVEPTDASFKEAIAVAVDGEFDGYVAVGGGSAMDTAKAANLYATYPADFLTYVNPPIGDGAPVPGPLKPLIAIPTTAGTGSETTGVAIFDYTELHAKTGIAHRSLRPALGIVDPENTRTLPPLAAACSGFDVLCHAIESITAIPYNSRDAADSPALRPSYQGSNPISDILSGGIAPDVRCEHRPGRRASRRRCGPEPDDARRHLCRHRVRQRGLSSPAWHVLSGFRHGPRLLAGGIQRRSPADPARHVSHPERAGRLPMDRRSQPGAPSLGGGTTRRGYSGVDPKDAGEILANAIIELMRKVDMPNGLAAVGFEADDIPALVEGTMPQHRVTKLSPCPAGPDDLSEIFRNAMRYW
ncbi:MAG: hydroxyacid-oxoacid transhydrogenase [Thermomicrobiales bacterium]